MFVVYIKSAVEVSPMHIGRTKEKEIWIPILAFSIYLMNGLQQ